ncbi:GNAT family N-acetyltransferase [Brevundimonas sp.]|uniref:GNAT family N-acetyltransferase n=1 Tax=Brevundimonas sp. TaxID=1871086 RepID=UPI002FC788DB
MIIRPLVAADQAPLLRVWRRAVEATHAFLSPAEIDQIEPEVREYLASDMPLWTLEHAQKPVGFLGLVEDEIAALFIDPDLHGQGLGRQAIAFALQKGANRLKVNEGNPSAVGFYKHIGFTAIERQETDDAGRPYPLIVMQWQGSAETA